ncbi:anthranilate phosphoribosyltransferase [Methanotorris igneus]|uniref:Anthranilate phosphoribosyltransferase n=1 Tax=Methanotorris igneus (strain DSM 5666 / JCM 11834 / Kol 5) TaxID=880724 RepID=F6BD09_METIK|nr:anthranilate phosphoribosyltransferase [Methanotorris igneus]AEF96370.1 Anthranilate phosphoribosyltransferase [Methanotorris igneus Kol 5]
MITDAIKKVVEFKDLNESEAIDVMNEIMSGKATPAQIASILTALRMKGETPVEIASFAKVMREFATKINPKVDKLVDTCGTGGDNLNTFNISTTVAFVVAGCGVAVAKHGNRSVSSKCGSADVLEALGVNLDLPPKKVEECIEKVGIGFLFAPLYHSAMKHALPVRKEIGIRTVFNVLGPLTNPANAEYQVVGVYDASLTEKIAEVLKLLGLKGAMVVHGSGMDEITTTGETKISELKDGEIKTYTITPERFGLKRADIDELKGGDAKENANILKRILEGEEGAKRDIVLLNAAATLYVCGEAKSLEEGIKMAEKSIDSGKAMEKLEKLVEFTNSI